MPTTQQLLTRIEALERLVNDLNARLHRLETVERRRRAPTPTPPTTPKENN